MQYNQNQLRDLTRQFLGNDDHRLAIQDLGAIWKDRNHGPRRYAKMYEDDDLTVWVLGWRPGIDTIDHHVDYTPIHGHGDSAALVTCIEGEIDNDDYGAIPQNLNVGDEWDCEFHPMRLASGHSVYVPQRGVHVMRCDERDGRGFSMTVHLYSPRLSEMTYYEITNLDLTGAPARLRLVNTWADPGERLVPTVA